MAEQEWLAPTDVTRMLGFLRGKGSDRKLRLFAVACCRRVWHLLTDGRSRKAITVAELFADGQVGDEEMNEIRNRYRDASGFTGFVFAEVGEAVKVNAHHAATGAAFQTRQLSFFCGKVGNTDADLAAADCIRCDAEERAVQSSVLRDIFDNPFRSPPPLSPAVLNWNDRTVPRIAQSVYDDRRMPEGTLNTSRLAILADALLDAGCDDDELIRHCRSEGPHVRGCWAVDLILGKE